MANEYLTRTPTSSGNRSVFTWAGWVKISDSISAATSIFGSFFGGSSRYTSFSFNSSSQLQFFTGDYEVINSSTTYQTWFITDRKFRDFGSWIHIVLIYETSDPIGDDRCKIYVNGSKVEIGTRTATATPGDVSFFNTTIPHYLGTWSDPANNGGQYAKGEMFDVFMVDGQALTPDVFGFYKDGDGYQSSGTTKETDFRPGQWSPRLPKSIKYTINRSGGFGANGFYLPMNDSSNPGADFHCTPNSIIKLKGEDLPQPRNGAPTTTDAYVSELREETGTLGFDGAVAFDGTGDYLSIADNDDLDLGTGDFTIEFFAYARTSSANAGYIGKRHPSSFGVDNSWRIAYNDTNDNINLIHTDSGGDFTEAAAPAPGSNWAHYAFTRQSGTLRVFRNGVKTSEASGWTYNFSNSHDLLIGANVPVSFYLDGFLSNARIIKGTALYTANFTAPTEPLTNVTNTKLLCCNSSTSATAATVTPGSITANGNVFATRNELTGSIVLAVPGISIDLITNGTFDSNTTGWTASNAVISAVDGKLKVDDSANAGGWSNAFYVLTTVAGRTYNLEVDVLDGNEDRLVGIYQGTYTANSGTAPSTVVGTYTSEQKVTTSFTATGTSVSIILVVNNNGIVYFDNVKVYDTTPIDYSADNKGSGTNKTITANNNASVAGDLGGYYGSAMTCDGTTDSFQISVPNNDPLFLQSDFTIECWANIAAGQTDDRYFLVLASGGSSNADGSYYLRIFQSKYQGIFVNLNNQYQTTSTNNYVANQWNHIAYVREGNQQTLYINGVCESVTSHTLLPNVNNSSLLYIGSSYGLNNSINAQIQDVRIYDGVAKYKGSFDVPKPYTPVGIEAFRTTADTCKNNFATFNPLKTTPNQTLTEGNLHCAQAGQVWGAASSSIAIEESSGKFYAEWRVNDTNYSYIGMTNADSLIYVVENLPSGYTYLGGTANDWGYLSSNGSIQHNESTLASGDGTLAAGDIVGVTFDSSNKQCKWYKNGVLKHTVTLTGNYPFYFSSGSYVSANTVNFGQNPSFGGRIPAGTNADGNGKGLFKYAPPTGFLALCTDNLPTPAIADPGKHFKTVLWTGDGTDNRSITGLGFKPDFVWIKVRNAVNNNYLFDIVRGADQVLYSDDDNEEVDYTASGGRMPSFDSDGFTVNYSSSTGTNNNGSEYAAHCWKAGGPAVSNTEGNITTQVSANPTAGFSIVKSNGPGTSGHGLNSTPGFIIQKSLTAGNWNVAHQELYAPGGTGKILLNLTNEVAPSSTTYMHGATATTFDPLFSAEQIAYVWAEIEGYSKFGSYTGNANTDGPFVYCGFRPSWVLIKNIDSANSHWVLWDSSRTPYNEMQNALRPNGNFTETNGFQFDFLSNGFKVRDGELSVSEEDDKFIFAAFAESPFKTANAK